MPNKKQYEERKANGLCTGCGGVRDATQLKCKDCRELVKKGQKTLISTRRENNQCPDCGSPASEGSPYCLEHFLKRAEKNLEQRERCLQNAICTRCHNPASASQERCDECILKTADAHQRKMIHRKEFGLCRQCGINAAAFGFFTCEYCLEDRRDELRAAKEKVFKHYGEQCKCCGESQFNLLNIDHIDGGGRMHLKKDGLGNGGSSLYSWIIRNNFPEMFQTLCFNCNFAKAIFGECPHKKINKGQCVNCEDLATIWGLYCEDCAQFKNLGQRRYTLGRKVKAISHYGKECFCCGEKSFAFLSIDHIDNDGKEDRKVCGGGGDKFYSKIIELGFPSKQYRTSCFNCNCGRFINGGGCPHQEQCDHEVVDQEALAELFSDV